MIGAYLEAHIDLEVWARVFPSWRRELFTQRTYADDDDLIPLSMLVLRSVYGLRQSAQRFLNMLDTWLLAYGFRISMGDQCLHILYNEAKDEEGIPATFIFLSSHIDDLQAVSSDDATWNKFAAAFTKRFPCKDVGHLDFHLGVSMKHAWLLEL